MSLFDRLFGKDRGGQTQEQKQAQSPESGAAADSGTAAGSGSATAEISFDTRQGDAAVGKGGIPLRIQDPADDIDLMTFVDFSGTMTAEITDREKYEVWAEDESWKKTMAGIIVAQIGLAAGNLGVMFRGPEDLIAREQEILEEILRQDISFLTVQSGIRPAGLHIAEAEMREDGRNMVERLRKMAELKRMARPV